MKTLPHQKDFIATYRKFKAESEGSESAALLKLHAWLEKSERFTQPSNEELQKLTIDFAFADGERPEICNMCLANGYHAGFRAALEWMKR